MLNPFNIIRIYYLILLSCLVSCYQITQNTTTVNGCWELKSWTATDSVGTVTYPYGEDAIGQLVYNKNGTMSLTLSANDRQTWGTFDHTAIDPQLVLNAFDKYFTYVADYHVDWQKGIVEHQIKACLFPDWVGKVQERHFEFKEDKLYLSAYNKFGRDHELVWVKSD